MPTVPYNPIPSVKPSEQGIGSVNVNAPAAAFGAGIAQETEKLGHTASHIGDEIFRRAMALQELQNDTEAKQADVQYTIQSSELHAKFNSLQGQAAVDAYPKYIEELKTTRDKIGEGLSNSMSKKMYDGPSYSFMARNVFNGAGHAASQQKQASAGASAARVDLAINDAMANPSDEVGFEQSLAIIRSESQAQGDIHGWQRAQTKDYTTKQVSAAWSARMIGLSKTEPMAAEAMLKENNGQLHWQDRQKVEDQIRNQLRSTGTRMETKSINSDLRNPEEGKVERSLETRVAEARGVAERKAPDDPLFEQMLVQNVIADYNQYKKVQKDTENQHIETYTKGYMEGGVTNLAELRAKSPAVAASIDALGAKKQAAIPGEINRFVHARDQQTNDKAALRMQGMAENDPAGFLNTDITKEPLSQGDMRKFIDLQNKKRHSAEADPRVMKAIGQMRGAMGAQMEALGVYKRTDNNKEDYDHFTGALQSSIEVWTNQNKKPPTYKDIVDTIGPEVLRQRLEPRFFGLWNSKTPFYTQTVPPEFSKKIKADVMGRGEPEPSDEEIYKAWTRTQLLKLYDNKSKPKQ